MSTITYTQHALSLPSLGRGSHLVTDHVVSSLPQIRDVKCGLLHLFLQHTCCALSMNENWDDDVRKDMSDALDGIVVEDKGAFSSGAGEGVGWEIRSGERYRVLEMGCAYGVVAKLQLED